MTAAAHIDLTDTHPVALPPVDDPMWDRLADAIGYAGPKFERRDTRIRLTPECDQRGSRWTAPKDTEDDHGWVCDCGTDAGRQPDGAWFGFEILRDGSMVCEFCDDTGAF